ncbi:type II secretion system protein F [Ignatzschineria ureiclastica]|nr:type II secretion system F family protein [Ignatzschineria ureiclastica]GGZ89985.1 type II secretion system protein F [Ignatzschineria ureiclastica]
MVQLKREEQLFLMEQLALLLGAGVAIVSAIQLLQRMAARRGFRKFLEKSEVQIKSGSPLSETFANIKGVPKLYIALMQVGESAGKLPMLLSHIVTIEKERQGMICSIRKALLYPLMIFVVAIGVLLFILIAVVPTFESFYASSGTELPLLTQHIMSLSQWVLSDVGFRGLLIIFILISLLLKVYQKSGLIRYQVDRLSLKVPFLRPILMASFNARFGTVMAIMITSGVPMMKGLALFNAGIDNRYLQQQVSLLSQQISAGKSLSISGENIPIFTDVMLTLIAVGEMSGQLAQSLTKAGEYHQVIVETRITRFIALLDPIALLFVGIIVGIILIALYLPLFSMGMAIG